jgi:hypothetical protein
VYATADQPAATETADMGQVCHACGAHWMIDAQLDKLDDAVAPWRKRALAAENVLRAHGSIHTPADAQRWASELDDWRQANSAETPARGTPACACDSPAPFLHDVACPFSEVAK